ncbi:MAG: hypothetical protein EP336_07835 [Rhodobacteraceae bacterium]|nr:MAG: hypothetical protein EP336_07835 [Paracoccaceae bacterium]
MSNIATLFVHQLDLAQTGRGVDDMDAEQALAFGEYGVSQGFGVSKMEACGQGASRGKHGLHHQILGVDDDGENWRDHKDPGRALALVRSKFDDAARDGLTLRYKIWMNGADLD